MQWMSLTLLSGRLPVVLQFPFLLKQDGSVSLVMWNVQIPGRITIEISVCCFDQQGEWRRPRGLYTVTLGGAYNRGRVSILGHNGGDLLLYHSIKICSKRRKTVTFRFPHFLTPSLLSPSSLLLPHFLSSLSSLLLPFSLSPP